jgi:hypothetical protein
MGCWEKVERWIDGKMGKWNVGKIGENGSLLG